MCAPVCVCVCVCVCVLHYMQGNYSLLIVMFHGHIACTITTIIVLCYVSPVCSNKNDFILKVAGRNSYIQGYNELIQFTQVVKALSKRQDVELALVSKLDTSLDQPRQIPDVSIYT